MLKTVFIISAAAFAGPALAKNICAAHPDNAWMSKAQITDLATKAGFEVRSVKKEDGCWEIKGKRDGKRVEAYLDPASGEVMKIK